ncbi:MAG: hypothetical protein WAL22_11930, partial [Solirubrobacteraceae bacterium]
PAGVAVAALLERLRLPGAVEAAPGSLADAAVRVMHSGPAASIDAVLLSVATVADALAQLGVTVDGAHALAAAQAAWAATA